MMSIVPLLDNPPPLPTSAKLFDMLLLNIDTWPVLCMPPPSEDELSVIPLLVTYKGLLLQCPPPALAV